MSDFDPRPQFERRDRRWTDERLDDLARTVRDLSEQMAAISDIRANLVGLNERLGGVSGDTTNCINELRDLKTTLDHRAEEQTRERKADRKWMVATLLATASLVIAALAVFLG